MRLSSFITITSLLGLMVASAAMAQQKTQPKSGLFQGLYSSTQSEAAPWLTDPEKIDPKAPPGLLELQIPSGKSMLNAMVYTANGAGPHPTVVMLHGFPGNEKNLDTAQMLRRAGFNVLYFHYRGAWGSGGDYSVRNILADAASVVAFARSAGLAGRHRIDHNKISLFGHSLGGFNALMTGSGDSQIACTVAAAPADLVNFVNAADPEVVVSASAKTPVPGLKDYSYADLVKETKANAARFSMLDRMDAFKDRNLMIVTGLQDSVVPVTVQRPLAAAAKTAGARLNHLELSGDHSFSWSRIAFNTAVTTWMTEKCM